jgi:hypothetical protein
MSWGCAKRRDERRKTVIERLTKQAEGTQAQRKKLTQAGLPTPERQKADKDLYEQFQRVQLAIDAVQRNMGRGTATLGKNKAKAS